MFADIAMLKHVDIVLSLLILSSPVGQVTYYILYSKKYKILLIQGATNVVAEPQAVFMRFLIHY